MTRIEGAPLISIRHGVIAGFVALVAVRLGLTLLPDSRAVLVLEQVTFLLPLLMSAVVTAATAARTRDVERRFWTLIGVAVFLTLIWEAYVSAYILVVNPAGPALPSRLQIVPLSAVAVFLLAVVAVTPFAHESIWARLRLYLDILAAMVLAFVAVFLFITLPSFSKVAAVTTETLVMVSIYPVVGVAMLIAAYLVFLPSRAGRWRSWEKLLAAAFTVYALGLTTWPLPVLRAMQEHANMPISGGLIETALACGNYLFFAAAMFRTTAMADVWKQRKKPAPVWDWVLAAYPVVLVVLVPVLGVIGLSVTKGRAGTVTLLASVLLSFVLVMRSWLLVSESAYHQGQADSDQLTGLPNELRAKADLDAALLEARRFGDPMSLAVLDIDDFSRVNDVEGHFSGDRLLADVAEALTRELGGQGRLYRLSGDEVGVLMPARPAEAAGRIAGRLVARVSRECEAVGLRCSMSGGVAVSAGPDDDSAALTERAIRALQVAKMRERGSIAIYDPDDAEVLEPEERLDRARKQSHMSTMRALAAAVDARDPLSRDHSRRTARLARELALALGVGVERVQAIELAALVHDVGRLAMPDGLLGRHVPASESEWARVREHVELGERILNSTEMAEIRPWVRAHHENWDGTGYPDGSVGEEIPFEARVIAVCNAYDAMTSGLYRDSPLTSQAALQEIDLGLGREFDPDIGEAFIQMVSRRAPRFA